MSYNPDIHHRRSIRLRSYDYAWSGAYFVTIIVRGRQCLFGDVENGCVHLTEAGHMIEQNWQDLPRRFPFCDTDQSVVMPNHFHGVLIFHADSPGKTVPSESRTGGTTQNSLGHVMQAFKSLTTKDYIKGVREKDWTAFEQKLWLRNYWDRIIRNDVEWQRANEYIFNNPARWESDKQNPEENARLRSLWASRQDM